ncbi:unnamed protein product [Acanthosepion pharaonis]|uniref:Uncharacterized protein n=1 Tax=Acanthosepion pharaonis TaxID=158019 RepID=A0A812CEK2_ACAPH|nr:unnamed protein product [Sepia pharaonis]
MVCFLPSLLLLYFNVSFYIPFSLFFSIYSLPLLQSSVLNIPCNMARRLSAQMSRQIFLDNIASSFLSSFDFPQLQCTLFFIHSDTFLRHFLFLSHFHFPVCRFSSLLPRLIFQFLYYFFVLPFPLFPHTYLRRYSYFFFFYSFSFSTLIYFLTPLVLFLPLLSLLHPSPSFSDKNNLSSSFASPSLLPTTNDSLFFPFLP